MATYTVRLDLTNSDPSTWGTWLDDAASLTLPSVGGGETAFDTFMGYYPCVLNRTDQTEKLVDPNDYTKYTDDSSVSASDGDLMVCFPNRGYKISWHDNNTLDVSVTDEANQNGYIYFTYNGNPSDQFYIGAYKGSVSSEKLRSVSGVTPTGGKNITQFREYAQAVGDNYELLSFYPLTYLQCCSLIKYKGNNLQTILGKGYTEQQNIATTGGANSRGLNYAESTGTYQCKLFGIEDFYGNIWSFVDGVVTNNTFHLLTSDGDFNNSGSEYEDQGQIKTASQTASLFLERPKATTSKMGFSPDHTYGSGSNSTYFCDSCTTFTKSSAIHGGAYNHSLSTGVFTLNITMSATATATSIGARLMYFGGHTEPPQELELDTGYKNVKILINNNVVATQDIVDRITINYGCTDGTAPGFGATFSPHCDVEINSNDILDSTEFPYLDLIKMGAIFEVSCEHTIGGVTGWLSMGKFEIATPPQYTEDYGISFSGEGMLGSVFDRTKVDYSYVQVYDQEENGRITIQHAISAITDQTGIYIELPDELSVPADIYTFGRIIIPIKSTTVKKNLSYTKRFIKITIREWLAGIALMLGCNVIEYGGYIKFKSIQEASADYLNLTDYFTGDSYTFGYLTEKMKYLPKSMYLSTYSTTPLKNNGTTVGYCIESDCKCNSVYAPLTVPITSVGYDVNVDLQWIGRSFESFFFSNSYDGESGIYEDETPYRRYTTGIFAYVPSSWDFSGWHYSFKVGNFILVKVVRKNTETQIETDETIPVYIMDMTWEWAGTINVQISCAYNGDVTGVNTTVGNASTVDDLSTALNYGVSNSNDQTSVAQNLIYLTSNDLL